MPVNILSATNGEQQTNSVSGPSSYPTGGFSVDTDLARASEALVGTDAEAYEARVESTSDNSLVIGMYSQGSGTEIAAGTDLSGDSLTYNAYML